MTEWHTIIPGPGESVRDVAVRLLALADAPSDVRTARGGTEFVVAPYVAERYVQPEPAPRRSTRKKGDG